MQLIFDTFLNLVKDSIDTASPDMEVRNVCVRLLHHFATLNKEAAHIVRQDPCFAPIIWYERIRLNLLFVPLKDGPRPLSFFLEGLPKNPTYPMPIFGAPVAFQLPVVKCKDLRPCDIVEERFKAMAKIDSMEEGTRFTGLVEQLDRLTDMPVSVPQRVRMFVSRMRSVCNGVRDARPKIEFTHCRNEKCNRFFYCGGSSASPEVDRVRFRFLAGSTPIEMLDCSPQDPVNEGGEATYYWEQCGGIPVYKDPLMRFCSSACCVQWRRHVDRVLPQSVVLDPEEHIKKVGINRISSALNAALRRNAAYSAALKSKPGKRALRKATAVDPDVMSTEIGRRIDMLNIDVAILYWSNVVSGCPENIYGRDLPGDRPGWRNERTHIKTARTIALMYTEEYASDDKPSRALITDLLKLSKFLSRVRTQAMQLL